MRYLIFLPLIFIFSGCATPTSQSNILAQAKAEVSKRENWGDRAVIRVEKKPDNQYMYWRDINWKVSAGAFNFSDYPSYNGTRVIPGTERELTFTRGGCLTGYKDVNRSCAIGSPAQPAPAPSLPVK